MRKKQVPCEPQSDTDSHGSLLPFESLPKKKNTEKQALNSAPFRLTVLMVPIKALKKKKKNYLQAYKSRSPLL